MNRSTDESTHSNPLFSLLYDTVTTPFEHRFAPHRSYLADNLTGTVLDLGAGTGALFPYIRANECTFHALEPDPSMRKRAYRKASELDLSISIQSARAESLPYDDETFDVVIASLVFCSIADPDRALSEIVRVLKPHGEFRFFEHVGADGWRRSMQRLLSPIWRRVAGNCHLHRETTERFVSHPSLGIIEIERTNAGIFPTAPMIRGRMYRRPNSVR